MLFARLIHAEPLEVNIPTRPKLGLHGSGNIDWGLHAELSHATLHDAELERDDAGHFDGATETDLAVALREVQVADAEFRAGHVDGQKDFGAAGEVFNVAVACVTELAQAWDKRWVCSRRTSMFRSPRNRPRAFLANLRLQIACRVSSMHVLLVRGLGDGAFEVGVCGDEFAFAFVPITHSVSEAARHCSGA
jgi:hypothetical protein